MPSRSISDSSVDKQGFPCSYFCVSLLPFLRLTIVSQKLSAWEFLNLLGWSFSDVRMAYSLTYFSSKIPFASTQSCANTGLAMECECLLKFYTLGASHASFYSQPSQSIPFNIVTTLLILYTILSFLFYLPLALIIIIYT